MPMPHGYPDINSNGGILKGYMFGFGSWFCLSYFLAAELGKCHIIYNNNNNNYIFITRTHLPKDTRGAQLYNSISYWQYL